MWYDLIGVTPYTTVISYTTTQSIVSGRVYRFQVRARNVYGWGPFSNYYSVTAATTPNTMIAPVTSIDSASGNLVISWQAPQTGGVAITAYNIEIADRTGSVWTEQMSNCNGRLVPIVSALSCSIPMSLLTASPYNYIY